MTSGAVTSAGRMLGGRGRYLVTADELASLPDASYTVIRAATDDEVTAWQRDTQ